MHQALPVLHKLDLAKWFGKNVRRVLGRGNVHCLEFSSFLIVVEEVNTAVNVARALARIKIFGNIHTRAVVHM